MMKSKLQKLSKLTLMKLYGERHQARKKQKQRKQLCECVISLGGTGHPGASFVTNVAAEEAAGITKVRQVMPEPSRKGQTPVENAGCGTR